MSRNHYSRNRPRYFDDDDEDECCCDCQTCCGQLITLKSMAFCIAGICLFLLGMLAMSASVESNTQRVLLGGWNTTIARKLIRDASWNKRQKDIFNSSQTVYVLTPTYARPNQKSLFTALAQTFYFVEDFHWIVIEDSPTLTPWIRDLLDRFNFNFTQIACDRKVFCKKRDCKKMSAKGSVPRNCGLMWLKESGIQNGVMYFADDDNFYDVRLFDEIRNTKRLSILPVGGFVNTGLSSPVVVKEKIVKFIDPWISDRKWPVDMAGFATNIGEWRRQGCPLFIHVRGYLETRFLQDMHVTKDTLEVVGANATEILVWHNTIRKVACNKGSKLWKSALKGISSSNLDVLRKKVQC